MLLLGFVTDGSTVVFGLAVVFFLLWLLYSLYDHQQTPYPLPPGPPGKFLFGNLGQVSHDHPEEDYIRWGKQYSKQQELLKNDDVPRCSNR